MSVTLAKALSDADIQAVLMVAHEANKSRMPSLWYETIRRSSPLRRTATWWLMRDGGTPAAACLLYDLSFGLADGATAPGYGGGAVATRPGYRRRGLASQLCRRVADEAEARGASVGLLFSAIPPALYARLGYVVTPAWQPRCADPAALAASGPRCSLRALDPVRDGDAILELYGRHHAGRLHLARTSTSWPAHLERNPRDGFVGWGDPLRGYIRLHAEDGELEITELIAPDPEDVAPALRAAAALTVDLPKEDSLMGWFPPCAELADHFIDEGRARTLPMVRGDVTLDGAQFWSSDYF